MTPSRPWDSPSEQTRWAETIATDWRAAWEKKRAGGTGGGSRGVWNEDLEDLDWFVGDGLSGRWTGFPRFVGVGERSRKSGGE